MPRSKDDDLRRARPQTNNRESKTSCLQTIQFHSATRSALLAILLQAVVFGVSHGYQGIDAMLRITVYGIFFGLTAHLCKSILPTILTHAWQDVFSGIIQRWSSIL